MGDSKKKENKANKPSFFKGIKTEFMKISWPTKNSLVKESVAVIGISVVLGLFISRIDTVIQFGIKFLTM